MLKNFDAWNSRKKILDATAWGSGLFYYEREIWWCAVGVNIGVEINGKNQYFERPVLIVKKFNKEMFWGVPFTTGVKDTMYHYPCNFGGRTSSAVLSQLRLMDQKRLMRKIGTIQESDFIAIRKKLSGSLLAEGASEAEAHNTSMLGNSQEKSNAA